MLRPYKNLHSFVRRTCSRFSYHKNHGTNENVRKKDNNSQESKFHYHKSKGQHILTNQRVLDSIVRKSAIRPNDTVLEIGPGTGNLTMKLLEASQRVVAIEIDKRMVEILNKRVAECSFEDRICVICKDALKTQFPYFDLVVANIPYGISSPLVAKLVFGAMPFRSATLLLQKEFAHRLLANPGESEYNRLAVNVKLVADVEYVMDVSKRDFVPSPKVDSSVVIIRPKNKEEVPEVNLEEWWAFTRTCFSKKNKTLGATFKQKRKVMELMQLSKVMVSNSENSKVWSGDDDDDDDACSSSSSSVKGFNLFKEKIVEVLKAGDFEDKRPSKLCNEELMHLLALLNEAGIYFHGRSDTQDALADAYSSE